MNACIVVLAGLLGLVVGQLERKLVWPTAAAVVVSMVAIFLLAGCTTAPTPGTTRTQSNALSDALDRIGTRTAGQATGMGGREVSRGVYSATGGSFVGQVGSAAVRNTATELQRWWSGR